MGSDAQNFNVGYKYMGKKSAAAEAAKTMSVVKPCKKKKTDRVSIFSPWANRMVSVNPYGPRARKLYKFYIEELGYDTAWVGPKDLKFYEESGRFRRVKPAPEPEIATRLSYKSYLACHTLNNVGKVKGYKGFELLRKFKPQLEAAMAKHKGLKVYPAARCVMDKTLAGEVIGEIDDFYVSTGIVQITAPSQVDAALSSMIGGMTQRVPEQETQGSGWVFQRVSTLEIHMAKYQPLKGSSYLELPKPLALKKAIVNVKNADEQCFKWAILSALFPASKDAQRVGKYAEHENKLDWSGMTFPVTLDKIRFFERRNNLSVNVYGCEIKKKLGEQTNDEWVLSKTGTTEQKAALLERRRKEATYSCQPYLLQKSTMASEAAQHVDLLLLEEGKKSHYC